MDRLTFEGNFCDIAQCESVPGGSYCEDGACSQRKVWERLKSYEDTGYTPAALATAVRFDEALARFGTTPERLVELMEADKEGRVAVLPCKVGDTLWLTASYYTERLPQPMEARVVRIKIDEDNEITYTTSKGVVRNKNFGKSVFLTREEAEKALEARNGDQ